MLLARDASTASVGDGEICCTRAEPAAALAVLLLPPCHIPPPRRAEVGASSNLLPWPEIRCRAGVMRAA
jgi:hypothetical protein